MATVYILDGDFPGKKLFFNELNATFYTANRKEPLAEAASITDLVVWSEFRSDPLLVVLFYLALPVVGWVLQWIASRSPNMVRFIAKFADGRSLVGSMNKDAFGKLEQMIHGMSHLDAESQDDEDTCEHVEEDILFPEAVNLVRNERWASVSILQRHFDIDSQRATDLFERLQKENVVGKPGPLGQSKVIE